MLKLQPDWFSAAATRGKSRTAKAGRTARKAARTAATARPAGPRAPRGARAVESKVVGVFMVSRPFSLAVGFCCLDVEAIENAGDGQHRPVRPANQAVCNRTELDAATP